MTFENIELEERENGIVIRINRPKQLNALNVTTIKELASALSLAESNHKNRYIVISGEGEKAFVAGADIKEFAHFSVEEGRKLSKSGQEDLFDKIENLSIPVIAAINGYALGGGLELAMSAAIRFASSTAKMGLPEVSLGLIPGYGGTQRLTALVGKGKAMELILSAQMIDSEEAHRIGLVNHVVEQTELISSAVKLGEKIARNSPAAIRSAIIAVNAHYDANKEGFEKEIEEFGKCFGTEDFKEGTTAFLEKRKPIFTGA